MFGADKDGCFVPAKAWKLGVCPRGASQWDEGWCKPAPALAWAIDKQLCCAAPGWVAVSFGLPAAQREQQDPKDTSLVLFAVADWRWDGPF